MTKKLYRSRSDSMLGGVCGGLGGYFDIDSNLIRLIFVLLGMANGIGVLIYLAMWLIVPQEGRSTKTSKQETFRQGADEIAERARTLGNEARSIAGRSNVRAGAIIGTILIILGGIFLLRNFGVFWAPWLRFDVLWPLLLVIGGVMLLWRRNKGDRR